jgi:outer membrane protein
VKRHVARIVCLGLSMFSSVLRADDLMHLSLKEAEQRAVSAHPQIQAGHYAALAAGEVARQFRSAYFPTVSTSFTGATAQDGTRIAAGGLNNPTILDRFAAGFSASQLLTDFGRTSNLVQGQLQRADALQEDAASRKADVLLQVDRAYFAALGANAVLKVAEQTVRARQLVVDQVEALAAGNLKSSLDVSFAKVNLAQAQLLLAEAKNDVQAAYATLTAALGVANQVVYDLEDEPVPPPPLDDASSLAAEALRDRPDAVARRLSAKAAASFASAERALWFPSISLVGAAGLTPYHQVGLNDRYSAVGVNVTVPLTNGNLYAARHAEATFRGQVESEGLRDIENQITRDVTIAWLNARTAYQKMDLTNQLFTQASDAFDLAEARYNLGLSSIVEYTQAQLNKTEAEIEQARAKYEYQTRTVMLRYQMGGLR